jgi:hypothetical protein
MDCLRLAMAAGVDEKSARLCRAQAAMMMRQSQGALNALRRDQAVREKAEAAANPRATLRAGTSSARSAHRRRSKPSPAQSRIASRSPISPTRLIYTPASTPSVPR